MQVAKKTLKLFEKAVYEDGGAAYRKFLKQVLPHIADAYRSEDEEGFRSHLGASQIGKDCARELWYSFRWFSKPYFSGRMTRLFNRGHLEEGRFIALMLAAGIQVYQQDENGNQFRISGHGGHYGGSGDGVGFSIPDIPEGLYALLEFKTHNDKSFQKLKKEGVKKAKPEHYIQMQTYLFKMGLQYALYVAVNKNDDELWAEVVEYDGVTAKEFESRAELIIFSQTPLNKISSNESWYQCKFCEFAKVCHKGAEPEINCRTCRFSLAETDGTWICRLFNSPRNKEEQLKGCNLHSHITR